MVIYNGAILAQWGQTSRRFMTASVRKSLLSALYGIAVGKGIVDLDETIGAIGIDDISPLTEIEKSAKVSDLLKARSGVYHPAAYETGSMKKSRPKRGSHKPGTRWYYNNWDFNTLAAIYNNKTSDDMFEAFKKQLAVPLRMQDFELRHTYYHLEPEHSRYPAYPFRMSARDLARIGLLFLNEGRWMNKQIIPSEWVHESTQPHSTYSNGDLGNYGYMWWTFLEHSPLGKLGTYAAFGNGGQAIYVVPGAKLVFVHSANTYEGKRSHVDNILIRNILLKLLKARTGASLPDPKLVTLDKSHNSVPGQILSKVQTSGLIRRTRT
jgi:CubicO group peptidase (beta-lactamase class C family)